MNCNDCPYDDYKKRNDRYNRLYAENDHDWQLEYLCCDKVGGDHLQFGYCSDCDNYVTICKKNKRKIRSNHHETLVKYKRKWLRYVCKTEYLDYYDKRNYFIRIYENKYGKLYYKRLNVSGIRSYCKKQTNKKVRKTDIANYSAYKKEFEYWYEIY